jgi:hypothetical protein
MFDSTIHLPLQDKTVEITALDFAKGDPNRDIPRTWDVLLLKLIKRFTKNPTAWFGASRSQDLQDPKTVAG